METNREKDIMSGNALEPSENIGVGETSHMANMEISGDPRIGEYQEELLVPAPFWSSRLEDVIL